jgi:hypothetical protein
MESIIAKCGYRCDLCPVYEANFKLDPDKQKMCDAWSKYLGGSVEPDAKKAVVTRIVLLENVHKKKITLIAHIAMTSTVIS